MDVDRLELATECALDVELYALHHLVGDRRDTGAVLQDDKQVNADLLFVEVYLNATVALFDMQEFRQTIYKVRRCHADHAVTFQRRLRGKAGDGIGRYLDA